MSAHPSQSPREVSQEPLPTEIRVSYQFLELRRSDQAKADPGPLQLACVGCMNRESSCRDRTHTDEYEDVSHKTGEAAAKCEDTHFGETGWTDLKHVSTTCG